MKKRSIAAVLVAAAAAALAGCHHKKNDKVADAKPMPAATASTAPADDAARKGLPDPGQKVKLETIYFAFDSWQLDDSAKATLSRDAQLLKENTVKVVVEGHADERGTTQYNLALGERRAAAVKTYLLSLGVPRTQLSTVSYGNERPAVPGHDESAWSKNRRAEIAVSGGSDRVSSSY